MAPRSTARFLESRRDDGFVGYNLSGVRPGGVVTPESVGCLGTARFAGSSVVPEPTSLLLVGTGLLAVLRKRMRGAGDASMRPLDDGRS